MKRIILFVFLTSILLITACSNISTKEQTADTGPQITETPSLTDETFKEISIIARQWEFNPNIIEVNQGDNLRLKIKSIDVMHGFAVPDYDIDEVLTPNEELIVEFKADKKGTFEFRCTVFCGSGHSDMKGTLLVK